jgi:hypothetical protein
MNTSFDSLDVEYALSANALILPDSLDSPQAANTAAVRAKMIIFFITHYLFVSLFFMIEMG